MEKGKQLVGFKLRSGDVKVDLVFKDKSAFFYSKNEDFLPSEEIIFLDKPLLINSTSFFAYNIGGTIHYGSPEYIQTINLAKAV